MSPMMELNWTPVRVNTGSPDEEGRLVLVDDKLVAVLVRLSGAHPEPELQGAWFVEVGFGPLLGKHGVFATFEEAAVWVRQNFGAKDKRGPGLARTYRSEPPPRPSSKSHR